VLGTQRCLAEVGGRGHRANLASGNHLPPGE
jgi:hypothetical protein